MLTASSQDTFVSVLESAATRRDAKNYLQKYVPQNTTKSQDSNRISLHSPPLGSTTEDTQNLNVAIVKLDDPQRLHPDILHGIAKTLSQLRILGLLALVVIECRAEVTRRAYQDGALSLCQAIGSYGGPGAKVVETAFMADNDAGKSTLNDLVAGDLRVVDHGSIANALQHQMITVIPSLAQRDAVSSLKPANAQEVVLALTKFLTGLQFDPNRLEDGFWSGRHEPGVRPSLIASVERFIILDSVGGPPMVNRPDVSHRFINLEQEYEAIVKRLREVITAHSEDGATMEATRHIDNLSLAKKCLEVLPPTSSALLTSPRAAANLSYNISADASSGENESSMLAFDGMVTTRNKSNPLLHNLLTDRPVFSPSLPVQRLEGHNGGSRQNEASGSATLVKRGMPVTIYPTAGGHWQPPPPGSERFRLTDRCVDLPRLIHLIEDSFARKLDADDYLRRVNNRLAGIIIAGQYEGCAILTWEHPDDIDEEDAFRQGRLVPYLDKFAVLKSRQGGSAVADIIFNAMVQDCFPHGVCWRSRKDNPVNKWYFERSAGTSKLSDSNWTMFWTTQGLDTKGSVLKDYESVCRTVQPSWADNKSLVD